MLIHCHKTHAPYAAMKLEPYLSLCSTICMLNGQLDVIPKWVKYTLKTKWQRTHEGSWCLLASPGCIWAFKKTWMTRTNGRSQDSQTDQWIRFKQHNVALSVAQRQVKQLCVWINRVCSIKLMPASMDPLVTVIRLLLVWKVREWVIRVSSLQTVVTCYIKSSGRARDFSSKYNPFNH